MDTLKASLPVILVLGEGVVVVMDPLLFQGQSLDLQLCALGLLHGLELVGCRHGTSEGGWLGQVTERSTCQQNRVEKRWSMQGYKRKRERENAPRSVKIRKTHHKRSALWSF